MYRGVEMTEMSELVREVVREVVREATSVFFFGPSLLQTKFRTKFNGVIV